jgi:hypothetical protein
MGSGFDELVGGATGSCVIGPILAGRWMHDHTDRANRKHSASDYAH